MTDISPNKLNVMKASPKCIIGSARKFLPISSINTYKSVMYTSLSSPVAYDHENDKQMRMSMGVIGKEKRFSYMHSNVNTPGPAKYIVEFHKAICKFMKNSRTTSTFGKAKKYNKDRNHSPGPGRYNIDSFKSLRMSFTKVM